MVGLDDGQFIRKEVLELVAPSETKSMPASALVLPAGGEITEFIRGSFSKIYETH